MKKNIFLVTLFFSFLLTPTFVFANVGIPLLVAGYGAYFFVGIFIVALIELLYISKKISIFKIKTKTSNTIKFIWYYIYFLVINFLSTFIGLAIYGSIDYFNSLDEYNFLSVLYYLIIAFFLTILIEYPFVKLIHKEYKAKNAFKNTFKAHLRSYVAMIIFFTLPTLLMMALFYSIDLFGLDL